MEHALTCNNLKCRRELSERALVTTCSHIFCMECAQRLGVNGQEADRRNTCPACHSQLTNPDDAVITNLNPSEDYKTSVLSGLSPNVIMECAGRALSFWAYQTTQDTYYQQYLYKTLTDKYSNLSVRLEKTVNDANSEIEGLHHKLSSLAAEQDALRRKNDEISRAYKDKSRKVLQLQELYDKVKRKAELGQIQRAASDAVDSTFQTTQMDSDYEINLPTQSHAENIPPPAFSQSHRIDISGMNTGLSRNYTRMTREGNHWPRLGGPSHRDTSEAPVGGLRRSGINTTSSALGLPPSEPSDSGDGGKPVQIFARIREKTREWHKLRRAGCKAQNLRAQYLAEQAKIQGTVSPPNTISRPAMELQRLLPGLAELPGDNTDAYSQARLEPSQAAQQQQQYETPGSRPLPATDDPHPHGKSGKFIIVSDPVLFHAKGSAHQHKDMPRAQRNGNVEYERDLKILSDEPCIPQPRIGPRLVVQDDDIEVLLETRKQTIRRDCEQLREVRIELERQILVAKEFAFQLYCQTHKWEYWSPILQDPVPLLQVLKGLQTTMLWLQARVQWYERKYPGLREQYNTYMGLQTKTSEVVKAGG
ncbi:unnamed protein product [Fusarium fujikuroi]|uniref:RING-type domain-containing protein n=1 Tax=Fusarium fujikuroi TaxID=5127 RepID=A0A9Q9UEL9_FUSFU|nr:unnamed protein product [Fusarium fujikuroi]VTT78584.1 unnamed protein product [Fusarium fujikuroi]VZI15527.1 unnamed protein product [Fusarium fujikuroi]